ncbi:MAG: hypothetical protein HAW58_00370 [Candidatus Thioglobus sp.]|nr:hypothetical protein [Candidatus Thioglobus sp.]
MKKLKVLGFWVLAAVFSAVNADSPNYISTDFGINFASGLDTMNGDNDVASRCDRFIFMANAATDCVAGDTWDQLRGHKSANDPNDPNSTVAYKFKTDIAFSALSINLKYAF